MRRRSNGSVTFRASSSVSSTSPVMKAMPGAMSMTLGGRRFGRPSATPRGREQQPERPAADLPPSPSPRLRVRVDRSLVRSSRACDL